MELKYGRALMSSFYTSTRTGLFFTQNTQGFNRTYSSLKQINNVMSHCSCELTKVSAVLCTIKSTPFATQKGCVVSG